MCGQTTKQKTEWYYVREFSQLGQYQQAYALTYSMCKEASGYRVELSQTGVIEKQVQIMLYLSQEEALQLLSFLYENAVSVEICKDVLADLLSPCAFAANNVNC